MSYDVHGEGGMAARWRALPTAGKLAIGAVAVLFVASAMSGDGGGAEDVPPAIKSGARLASLQIQGEKPIFHAQGIEVTDVDGGWAEIRFGDDDKTRRWIHFAYVAGFQLQPE